MMIKKYLTLIHLVLITGIIFLVSCSSSNQADLEKILDPGQLPYLKSCKLIEISSHNSSDDNLRRFVIPAGTTATILNATGPGVITRIWFTVDSKDPYFLRRILIRMYWDDEEHPSVEVPFGDFFGCGFDYRPYSTPYLGMTGGGYTCFFPMPFERQAKIDIINETGQDIAEFSFQINYQKLEKPISLDVAYFHANWHRDVRTNYDSDYTVLRTSGKGHLVGVNMNIQSYDGTFSFLDGFEKIYIDGEKRPSIFGTATEDYFSSGWNFKSGEYIGPYNGLILKDDSLSRIAAYRFHISDVIPFKKSIQFSIEHGRGNKDVADYSSTVYWYQTEPHKKFSEILKAGQRIPLRTITPIRILEAENLKFNFSGIPTKVIDMSDHGPEWSGFKQLLIESGKGDSFHLNLPRLEELAYTIHVYYSKAPNFGNVSMFIGNEKVGEINGYSPIVNPGGSLILKDIPNPGSELSLRFVVDGKDSISKGFLIGLDGIKLIPQRNFFTQWLISGPFQYRKRVDNPKIGLDSVYDPEKRAESSPYYLFGKANPLKWKLLNTQSNGYISLKDFSHPNSQVICYALTYLYSDEERIVNLLFGSDDGIKIFFNDKQIFRLTGSRIAEPDQDQVFLHIHKGWNKLLIKVGNNFESFGFYARIIDRDRSIVFSPDQILPEKILPVDKKSKKKTK